METISCGFDLNSGDHPTFDISIGKFRSWYYFNDVSLYRLNTFEYIISPEDEDSNEDMKAVNLPTWSWWMYFDESDKMNGSCLSSGTNADKYHLEYTNYKKSMTIHIPITKEEGKLLAGKVFDAFSKIQPQFSIGNFEMNPIETHKYFWYDVNGMKYDHKVNTDFQLFEHSPIQKILFSPKDEI